MQLLRKNPNLVFLLLLSLALLCCDKRLIDKRNKYCGAWHFLYSQTSWTMSAGAAPTAFEEFTGKIFYEKGNSNKDQVIIELEPGRQMRFNVDKAGVLSSECGERCGEFSGRDKLDVAYAGCSLARGGGVNQTISGIKE
jgi:hypothetical protein